ncbi:MAG: bifunctional riboflavin kinase/FAD synthetase [Candidatus Promineifilaceae bacterium]
MTASIHIHTLQEAPERQPTYLAVGSFDGVHKGHQALLQAMIARAKQDNVRTAVLTFFPHPKRVVARQTGRYYITTLADRIELLAQQGVDLIITHPFDETVQHTRAADFMQQLVTYLDLRQLWGGNFALGYQREGDIPYLRRLGRSLGYTVELVDALTLHKGKRVSSSRIRRAMAEGDMETVNGCLGRPYHLEGVVVKGDQRGRTIGFPTANLSVWEELLLPTNGVYAAIAVVDGESFMAATNIGTRPTVDGRSVVVEPHLLDFSGDLYGRTLRLHFYHRVRPEKKFDSLEALKKQIARDVQTTRQILQEDSSAAANYHT